ncbi:MAG: tripartite tricarboxylate transporter substrate binding protein [Betaproteobacteria bacterium]|nr:tripartite tricarboxylate transporter substrate binding protein [Betaproteobacteria bacterium]
MNVMKQFGLALVLAGTAFAGSSVAQAPDFPNRPIRIVVPFTPGGGVDVMTRVIGEKLTPLLGQPVVVENKPGAGGALGAEFVAKSPADGYTLFSPVHAVMTINTVLYKDLRYDPIRDFAPVTLITNLGVGLVVNPGLGVKNVAELITLAKSKPGGLSGGSPNYGSVTHLSLTQLNTVAGVNIVHVPYPGGPRVMAAVVSGELQVAFTDIVPALPLIKAGRVLAIGMLGAQRAGIAPDVPTMEEAGIKGFELAPWSAIFAPAGTPAPVIARLNREIRRVLDDPEVKKRLIGLGGEPIGSTPEELAERLRRELPIWTAMVRASGAKVE